LPVISMKIRIAAQQSTPIPGTLRVSSVVLNLRRAAEVFEARVHLDALRTTIPVWVSRLTPDERVDARFRVYALVLGKAGGERRRSLGDWMPNETLEPFLEAVGRRFAAIPVDPASTQPLSRDAWVDEQEFAQARATSDPTKRASRRTRG